MEARKTGRHTERPALQLIVGEPELKLRAWLEAHPDWDVWRHDGQWYAGHGGVALLDADDFSVLVAKLEVVGLVGPGEPPGDIA
jgi:hypothetical protein